MQFVHKIPKDVNSYRVRVLEAYMSRTIEEIRNHIQDFQIIRKYVNELEETLEEKQYEFTCV